MWGWCPCGFCADSGGGSAPGQSPAQLPVCWMTADLSFQASLQPIVFPTSVLSTFYLNPPDLGCSMGNFSRAAAVLTWQHSPGSHVPPGTH